MRHKVLLFVVIFLFGCQKSSNLVRYRWSTHHSNKLELESKMFTNSGSTIKVFDEIVERGEQKVGGAVVDKTFIQRVSGAQGELKFVAASFDPQNFAAYEAEAKKLYLLRYSVLETIKRKYLELQRASHIFEPELLLTASSAKPKFQYKIEYIPKDDSAVFSLRVSPSFAIESISRVEHCFKESPSLVFPVGPRLSELMETILSPLLSDGSLAGPRVLITSEDGQTAVAENGGFLFGPEDPRFDQVQAFFFAQKTLSYAERNWDLNLSTPIKIGLKAGYPNKTNTAYYYRGMVRLGEGDGVGYKHIPRDPSIVSHEIAHAIIDSLSGMNTEGEASSLNEGFADYLTASLWQNPELGHTAFLRRPFTRTVNVKTRVDERNGGLYHDSGIVSGTFWEIEQQIGAARTQKLALKSIVRLGANPLFKDVRPAIDDAIKAAALAPEEISRVTFVLDQRGWSSNNP